MNKYNENTFQTHPEIHYVLKRLFNLEKNICKYHKKSFIHRAL